VSGHQKSLPPPVNPIGGGKLRHPSQICAIKYIISQIFPYPWLHRTYYALGNEKKKYTFLLHFSRLFVTLQHDTGKAEIRG
jgi:hypothetical protein